MDQENTSFFLGVTVIGIGIILFSWLYRQNERDMLTVRLGIGMIGTIIFLFGIFALYKSYKDFIEREKAKKEDFNKKD